VVRVEDERLIEGLGGDVVRLLAGQHVEEVRGETQIRVGIDGLLAETVALERCERGRDLGGDPTPLPERRIEIVGVGLVFGFVGREHRNRSPQRGHGLLVGRGELLHRREDVVVDLAFVHERGRKRLELVLGRQMTVPEQVEHFLVARTASEVLDRVAAVDQSTDIAVDRTESRFGDQHTLEPFLEVVRHTQGFRTPMEKYYRLSGDGSRHTECPYFAGFTTTDEHSFRDQTNSQSIDSRADYYNRLS